jgi:hypothetical protein
MQALHARSSSAAAAGAGGRFALQQKHVAAARRCVRVAAGKKKELMMWEALREAVDEEMEKDPMVCVMGGLRCCCPLQASAVLRLSAAQTLLSLAAHSAPCIIQMPSSSSNCSSWRASLGDGRCRRRPTGTAVAVTAATTPALQHAGEDVGHYGGSYKVTYDLYKKYGDMRILDTPICGELVSFVTGG